MTRPRFADATEELALAARYLRDGRVEGDPSMVEAGKLTADQAADRLRIAASIAADWTAYAAGKLLAERSPATAAEKRSTLAEAHRGAATRRDRAWASLAEWRWTQQLDRGALWQLVEIGHPLNHHIQPYLHWESYAAALEALLWWQERPAGVGSKPWLVEVNRDLRADRQERRAA